MIPLGIDPSLTSCGFCVADKMFAHSPKTKGVERLVELRNVMLELMTEQSVDIVLIEGYAFNARNSQSHALGELGGVLRVAIHEADINAIEIPPTVRAKFATGRGNASKSEVVSAVSARTGILFEGKGADDMCDAWILQEMSWASRGRSKYDWPKQNLEALEKIDLTTLPF
mgnify:CR=1 FL=1|jgi:crossover junction endodeoxyribonuclease RuvC